MIYLLAAVVFSSTCFAQQKPDSVLRTRAVKWTGTQHKEAFSYGKPSFGPFITISVAKIDTPEINKQSVAARNSSIESSGGKTTFNQTKTVDKEKTTWYRLILVSGIDTTMAEFVVTTITRKEKQTLLGFIFGKTDTDRNRDYFYNRNMEGSILTPADSLPAVFSLSNYVNHRVGSGYFKMSADSLSVQTWNEEGFATEIVLADTNGRHAASVLFNINDIEVYVQNDMKEAVKRAVAALFAVIVSVKN